MCEKKKEFKPYEKIKCRACENIVIITEKEQEIIVNAVNILNKLNKKTEHYLTVTRTLNQYMNCCNKPNYYFVC